MAVTIKQRAFAGMWFMAAAALFIVPIFGTFANSAENLTQFRDYLILLLLSPILIAGLVGSLLGASILDAQSTKSWWRAALQGLLIALLAYLLYAIFFSAWEGYYDHGPFSPGEAFTQMLLVVLMWGAIFFGWVVAAIGAMAGWLLHIISGLWEKRTDLK